MTTSKQQHLLIGLPATGKTTYLAALWHVVQQHRRPCALRLEKLEGDSKYVNEIAKTWLSCAPIPRTNPGSEAIVSMQLQDGENGRITNLMFPDLSGESFELQWTTRQLTRAYDKQMRSASGALLFINPMTVVEPVRIDQLESAVAEAELALGVEQYEAATSVSSVWNAERAPTQVQLVELLQFIAARPTFRPPFRVAVMISAWDRVAAGNLPPLAWLERRMPLLTQFLAGNGAVFESTVYGVSAQGGEYDPAQVAQLTAKEPIERILLTGAGVRGAHDLTEPVHWLMQ